MPTDGILMRVIPMKRVMLELNSAVAADPKKVGGVLGHLRDLGFIRDEGYGIVHFKARQKAYIRGSLDEASESDIRSTDGVVDIWPDEETIEPVSSDSASSSASEAKGPQRPKRR